MKNKKKIAVLASLLMGTALFALAAVAAAGQGSSGHYNQGMHNGQMDPGSRNRGGRHGSNWNRWSNGRQGNWNNMSPRDRQKMQQEYNAFLEDTDGLRQELYQKNLELRNELGSQNPDNRKVANLQNETARLKSQLYQKEQAYMEKMRQINPNMGRGRMGGGMMSPDGNMMGPAGRNSRQ